jgi:hypothetical protein
MTDVLYIDSSHNFNFKLENTPAKWREDLRLSSMAAVTGYQEAGKARAVLHEFCLNHHRGLYHPDASGNAISWNQDVFSKIPGSEFQLWVHRSAQEMGVDINVNPARDFIGIGLKHKRTGHRILRINVHATAQATKPESIERYPQEVDDWKDWSIGNYWLDVIRSTAREMSRPDTSQPRRQAHYWHSITLGGDYNGNMMSLERWYYPGRILPSLFVADSRKGGLDHMQHTHGSDLRVTRRWSKPANTDHEIQFVEREMVRVDDYPAQH